MTNAWQDFGGNQVLALDAAGNQSIEFARQPYVYRLIYLQPGQEETLTGLGSVTLFCLTAPTGSTAVVDRSVLLQAGDSLRLERHTTVSLTARGGQVALLAAGVEESQENTSAEYLTRSAEQYKVVKPWGHELWINGQHPSYALKEIFIKQGTRTSLQYHHFKEETNVLVRGNATLVYRSNPAVSNEDAGPDDLGQHPLRPLSIVHVKPPVLHRIVAETDVLLYETSTPYLDDVVRVQDDARRVDGRIAAEHR